LHFVGRRREGRGYQATEKNFLWYKGQGMTMNGEGRSGDRGDLGVGIFTNEKLD
jgi:hypothetical protein